LSDTKPRGRVPNPNIDLSCTVIAARGMAVEEVELTAADVGDSAARDPVCTWRRRFRGIGSRSRGGKPGLKVSWQVTGVRQDAWAKAHPVAVEEKKPERGYYVHPELYGKPFWKRMDLQKPPAPTSETRQAVELFRDHL
jgi:hypothetical protein